MICMPRLCCRIWHRYYLRACAHSIRGKISPAAVPSCSYVQLKNDQMFHSHFVNLDGCRLVTVANENEISRRICEMQTTDELMNFVSIIDSESWTPELSSLLTERLVSTFYQSLCAIYPWLQKNIVTASKQLRLGDAHVLQDAAAPFCHHSAYKTWLSIIEHNCTGYNPDQLANALLSAINLFVDSRSSLMHRLLSETHRRLPDFSLTALAALSDSLKALPGDNYVLVRAFMKRIQTLLTTIESVNATELIGITTIFANMRKFVSADLQFQLVTWLLQIIQSNKEVLLSPTCVEGFVRLGYMQRFNDEHNSRKLIDIGIETCQRYIEQFTCLNVAKMCILLQTCSRHDGSHLNVFDILESHALRLLSHDSRLCEVIDLMNCLTRNTSKQVILHFYSALHSQLVCRNYIDGYSLSSLARTLVRMSSVSTDVLSLVQHFIVDQADIIVQHPHLFYWIEKFLIRHCFLDKDLERKFNDCLLSYARRNVGVSNYAASVVSAYLLPLVNDGLPTPVFKHVIKSVTQWHKVALYKHTLRISSLHSSLCSNHQLKQLNSVLYQTLCKHLDLVDSLGCLHMVASSLLKHSCQQHPIVTDRVMNAYTQYSPTLSDNISALRISGIFSRLNYYLPTIYDDLVRYVLSANKSNDKILVGHVVFACAKVGHVPSDADELLQLASGVYRNLIVQQNYRHALKLLYSLTTLQLFLDSELSKLFTLEMLEALDLYMAGNLDNPWLTNQIEVLVMFLNRAVVLECPHLDVLWFRDRAAKIFLNSGVIPKSDHKAVIAQEVQHFLSRILGGVDFVRSSIYSPYHYHLDFECLLDEHQKPVNVLRWQHIEKHGNSQKIAVCVLGRNSYCYNSKQLTGFALAKKRHLEIMNYKFVEIPYFDWYSMGLTDKKAKFDYIEKKLFQ